MKSSFHLLYLRSQNNEPWILNVMEMTINKHLFINLLSANINWNIPTQSSWRRVFKVKLVQTSVKQNANVQGNFQIHSWKAIGTVDMRFGGFVHQSIDFNLIFLPSKAYKKLSMRNWDLFSNRGFSNPRCSNNHWYEQTSERSWWFKQPESDSFNNNSKTNEFSAHAFKHLLSFNFILWSFNFYFLSNFRATVAQRNVIVMIFSFHFCLQTTETDDSIMRYWTEVLLLIIKISMKLKTVVG